MKGAWGVVLGGGGGGGAGGWGSGRVTEILPFPLRVVLPGSIHPIFSI